MKLVDLQADVALKELLRGTEPAGRAAAPFPHEATDGRRAGFESSPRRREAFDCSQQDLIQELIQLYRKVGWDCSEEV